jgi:tRNA threonylcarbamoyladenosine biosynthesis protein TsaB
MDFVKRECDCMLLLGIETSGSIGGVALVENGAIIGERPLANRGRRHAQSLAAETADLFQKAGLSPADCQGIAVSVGPGSFTGLRIGVVFAKTLAYSVGCPVAAVETMQAIAEEAPGDVPSVTVIADAQRGDLYVGRYSKQSERWIREGSISMHPALEWCRNVARDEIIAGPGLERWEKELKDRCRVLSDLRVPKVATIARIGELQLARGETADLWTLEPHYLRRSSAEEQWDVRHPS